MMKLDNPLFWYPPAETTIPYSALLSSFIPSDDDFEKDLGEYLGIGNCLLAGSGRVLLTLLLQALQENNDENRNEVLIPGYTCYSVAASIVKAGLKIRVYDLMPMTFNPDLESLKKGLGDKTLVVLGQHLFGIPCPLEEMKDMAHKAGAYLVEDAAQALGGTLNGHLLGAMGDFGLFSFGRGKPLPLGCGGALVGQKLESVTHNLLNMAVNGTHELVKAILTRFFSHKLAYGFMEKLPLGLGKTVFNPGFEMASMPSTLKRLGKKVFGLLETYNAHRRMIAEQYSHVFGDQKVIAIPNSSQPTYVRYPVVAGGKRLSKDLIRLGVRRMYPNAIINEPSIKPYIAANNIDTPNATFIAEQLITLPTHENISIGLAEQIACKVRKVYL
jgi:perosamine synthetase